MCVCCNKERPRSMCFPEYIYFTHKQSYIHTNIHTHILYIHTVLHSYKYISVYWIFFFYYKRQFDILLLCILCYTVRARSLLKSMHFLLVVSRSRVCKQLRVHATRSECHISIRTAHTGSDKLSIKPKLIQQITQLSRPGGVSHIPPVHSELFANTV